MDILSKIESTYVKEEKVIIQTYRSLKDSTENDVSKDIEKCLRVMGTLSFQLTIDPLFLFIRKIRGSFLTEENISRNIYA